MNRFLLSIFFCFSIVLAFGQATLPVSRTAWSTAAEPTGWTQSGCGHRTTTSACSGNDARIFNSTSDETKLFFNASPADLTFQLKNQGMSGESKLTVEESSDDVTWALLGEYGTATGATAISNCTDIVLALNATTRYIRWTYTKAGGNCDMDDVSVTLLPVADRLVITSIPGSTVETGSFDVVVCAQDASGNTDESYDFGTNPVTLNQTGTPAASISAPVYNAGCATFTITPADGANPYDLMFTATNGDLTNSATETVTLLASPKINEFHYDDDSGDATEFIEVFLPGATAGGDVSGFTISLYNGGDLSVYDSETLNNMTETCDALGCYYVWSLDNVIQNGSPDGIALSVGATLIEFISYEGDFTASGGPADGVMSTNIGVTEGPSSNANGSLQCFPSGWVKTPDTNTKGLVNCAITNIVVANFNCTGNGSEVTFQVTFDAEGTSGNFNVVDGSNNILGTGTSSPILATVASSIGQSITVNVVDVANTDCKGFPETVNLPNCSLTCPNPGDLVITEFMADPAETAETDGEYFEVYNTTGAPIDIDGWEIKDNKSNTPVVQINNGGPLIVPAGGFLVLGNGAGNTNLDYVYDGSTSGFVMANGSGDEVLLCCGTTVIAQLVYTGDDVTTGVAMELECIDAANPYTIGLNYVPSCSSVNLDADADTDIGSPGVAGNSVVTSVTPNQLEIELVPSSVAAGEMFELVVCATDGTNKACTFSGQVNALQTSGTAVSNINLLAFASNGCATFQITPSTLTNSTCEDITFDFSSSGLSTLSTPSISVKNRLFFEGFETCGTATWTVFDAAGASDVWDCDLFTGTPYGYMYINGEDGASEADDDWLIITTPIDMSIYQDIDVSFFTRIRNGLNGNAPIEFKYSEDYTGSGDPTTATWTDVPFSYDDCRRATNTYGDWVASGDIALPNTIMTDVYLAFRYQADGTGDGSVVWNVDSIEVVGCPRPCTIVSIETDNISACDPGTNTFTADVTVEFNYPPSTGTLALSGGCVSCPSVSTPITSPHIFTGVTFNADGTLKNLTASFSADTNCTLDSLNVFGTDIASCDPNAAVRGGLFVNEVFSNGDYTGSCFYPENFIELVVTGRKDDQLAQNINIEGWIVNPDGGIDDKGFMKFASCGLGLNDVKVGSIIVIYNNDNKLASIPADGMSTITRQTQDIDVYVLPHTSLCLEYFSAGTAYPGTTPNVTTDCAKVAIMSAFLEGSPVENIQTIQDDAWGVQSFAPFSVFHELPYVQNFGTTTSSNATCGNLDNLNPDDTLVPTPGEPNDVLGDNENLIVQIAKGDDPEFYADAATGTTSGFYTSSFDCSVLPVEWLYFEAARNGRTVELNWATASEINTESFIIEHSVDAQRFNTIGKVQAAGSSSTPIEYEMVHKTPSNGINYYRLKQMDIDGAFSFSEVRSVRMSSIKKYAIIRPSIAQSVITVDFFDILNKESTIKIYNSVGALVRIHELNKGEQSLEINIDNFAQGVYILQINMGAQVQTEKFVKR